MATVAVTCANFVGTYATLNGTRRIDITRRSVLRAVMTVGFQRLPEVFSFGWRGLLHRFGIALSAFSFLEGQNGDLNLSDEFGTLDMSEKGSVSYWYGMAFAKLISERELSVPWLAHVDRMRASGALTTTSSSNERGDLVGRDSNNAWHVLEAKGRSNPYPPSLITSSKQQAASVTLINGIPPSTTTACITGLSESPIAILLDDPSERSANGREWSVTDGAFFREYYRGIIDLLRSFGSQRERYGTSTFVVTPRYALWEFPPFGPGSPGGWRDLQLGLHASIYDNPAFAAEAVSELSSQREEGDDKVGPDGIALFGRMQEWESE